MLKPAERMKNIAPFHVMNILARARDMERQGRDVVHMEVGEPDFATPEPIIQAGIDSLQQGETHYTAAGGLPKLREAISNYYQTSFGVEVSPSRILVTPGASGALQLVLGTLIDPGDQVLMADPGYPCNRHMVRMFGGDAVMIPVEEEDDFQLSISQIDDHWNQHTRALMLANPSNPTGRLINPSQIAAIQELITEKKGALIVDEIYQGLMYQRAPETALTLDQDNLFIVNSFSKYFGMTGWRAGWLVAPEAFIPDLERLAQNIFLAAPTTAQYAALAAFQPESIEILEQRRQTFEMRRDYLYGALTDLGFGIHGKAEGAFYLYANISKFSDNSFEFAEQLLEQAGVAITPGKDFGSNKAEQFVRFAYTTDMDNLKKAVTRIEKFIG